MKPKNKRLIIVSILMVSFSIGCVIIFFNLRNNLVFFFSPSDIVENIDLPNTKIRLGGMVKKGSVSKNLIIEKEKKIQEISFIITDFENEIPVYYRGILPDLFAEGQGVVVEGIFTNLSKFNASIVLAKHDENYMPPELDYIDKN